MNTVRPSADSSLFTLRSAWLKDYQFNLRLTETGHVVSVGDGIAWVSGLPSAAMDDLLLFEDGSEAMVFDLNRNMLGAVLLKETEMLTAGVPAYRTRQSLQIPVGPGLLGRIVDPLGSPLDGLGVINQDYGFNPLQANSPAITARDFVHEPLYTGNKIIDTLIPIGKGQRQLIVGDEGLGRSSLAIDAVINQQNEDVYCVYVLIGQKRSTIVNTIETLREYKALDYTTVVVAEASSLPGIQHLAPFAGCAIAEAWMTQGHDTLVVYDDLSSHARTHRELSLLLRRPPGREAYPGDIFSVHARLLERSTCLNAGMGGGSMTALPIVETNEGEISDYIPTNLISITDGQIYLDRELFTSGFRPAVDIGKSVSRVGGQAQHKNVKMEAGRMKLDYMQFLELERFTRFGARLEASMQTAISRGRILREILKQDRLLPLPIDFHFAWLIAFNDGLLDKVALESIAGLLEQMQRHITTSSLTMDMERNVWLEFIEDFLSAYPYPKI